jgi:hypothetical protein
MPSTRPRYRRLTRAARILAAVERLLQRVSSRAGASRDDGLGTPVHVVRGQGDRVSPSSHRG